MFALVRYYVVIGIYMALFLFSMYMSHLKKTYTRRTQEANRRFVEARTQLEQKQRNSQRKKPRKLEERKQPKPYTNINKTETVEIDK